MHRPKGSEQSTVTARRRGPSSTDGARSPPEGHCRCGCDQLTSWWVEGTDLDGNRYAEWACLSAALYLRDADTSGTFLMTRRHAS